MKYDMNSLLEHHQGCLLESVLAWLQQRIQSMFGSRSWYTIRGIWDQTIKRSHPRDVAIVVFFLDKA